MVHYLNTKIIFKLLVIAIFFIILKEVVLLNEELLLIFSFLIFLYVSYDFFSYFFKQELQSHIAHINSMFIELLELKKKNLFSLALIYKRILSIKKLISRNSVYIKTKTREIKVNKSIRLIDILKIVIEEQLKVVEMEEIQLLKEVNINKIDLVGKRTASESSEEFTSTVLDVFCKEDDNNTLISKF